MNIIRRGVDMTIFWTKFEKSFPSICKARTVLYDSPKTGFSRLNMKKKESLKYPEFYKSDDGVFPIHMELEDGLHIRSILVVTIDQFKRLPLSVVDGKCVLINEDIPIAKLGFRITPTTYMLSYIQFIIVYDDKLNSMTLFDVIGNRRY